MDWIVILAGGGGTRLWPLSRRKKPKQFLPLLPEGKTLLGATVERTASFVPIERTVVVTAASQVREVLLAVPRLPPENVIVEPEGRNTAPCIGLACVEIMRRDAAAIIGVLPSDHFIRDAAGFTGVLDRAFAVARQGLVAVIGLRPTHPETGFGYIEAADLLPGNTDKLAPRPVARFVEKPDLATAERYVAAGHYLWNAGMFFFPAARMLQEIQDKLPSLGRVLDVIRIDPAATASAYPTAPKISIDYAVMEKLPASGELYVVEGDFGWNDVGSFAALGDVHPLDEAGNAILGDAVTIDARNNILVGGGRLIATIGVSDLIVVATDDAILVMPRERAQDVRKVVEALETGGRDPYL